MGTALLLLLLGGGCYFQRLEWIPAGYVGLLFDAGSGLQNKVYKPGTVFKGFRQDIYTYPTKLQAAIYTQDPAAGEEKTADAILVTTNDNANTLFDVAVVYRVKPEDVIRVFNAFGTIKIEEIQTTFIRRAVKEAANEVSTQYDLFSLMGAKRAEAAAKLEAVLKPKLAAKGITVEASLLGGCFPSQDIQGKITSRVNSYVELEISRLKREIAEIDRQVAVVKGRAQADAALLSASQTQARSLQLLRLDSAESAIEKWDGRLPAITPKSGQTVIVTQDLLQQLGGGK